MLNVMLMLSTRQPPDPLREIQWHVRRCSELGLTYVATPRSPTTLSRDGSVVVFYSSRDLGNRVLGFGLFYELVEIGSRRGIEIASRQADLYRKVPRGSRYWIGLSKVSDQAVSLADFGGTIVSEGEGNGLPLDEENLPASAARGCVYFKTQSALIK